MPRSAVDDELVGRLRLSVARLARLLRQQDESGMTPTMTATLATIAREGPLTLGALAAAEQVAPPTVTKAIDKLEAEGLVERIIDENDRRVCRVQITAAGHQQIEANRSRRNAWLADQLAGLSADERERLAAAVDVLEHLTTARRAEVRS